MTFRCVLGVDGGPNGGAVLLSRKRDLLGAWGWAHDEHSRNGALLEAWRGRRDARQRAIALRDLAPDLVDRVLDAATGPLHVVCEDAYGRDSARVGGLDLQRALADLPGVDVEHVRGKQWLATVSGVSARALAKSPELAYVASRHVAAHGVLVTSDKQGERMAALLDNVHVADAASLALHHLGYQAPALKRQTRQNPRPRIYSFARPRFSVTAAREWAKRHDLPDITNEDITITRHTIYVSAGDVDLNRTYLAEPVEPGVHRLRSS